MASHVVACRGAMLNRAEPGPVGFHFNKTTAPRGCNNSRCDYTRHVCRLFSRVAYRVINGIIWGGGGGGGEEK